MSSQIQTPVVDASIIDEIVQASESVVEKLVDDMLNGVGHEMLENEQPEALVSQKRSLSFSDDDECEAPAKRSKPTYAFSDDVTEDESSDEEEIDEEPTESDLEFIDDDSDDDEDDDAASYVAPEDEDLENIPVPTRRMRGRRQVNYIESDESDAE